MRIKFSLHTLFTAGASLLLFSCVEETAYHSSHPITSQIWEKKDTIRFPIDSIPLGKDIQLEVEVRTLQTYPYQNLSVIVEQDWEKLSPQRDTLNLQLKEIGPCHTPIFLTTSYSIPYNIKERTTKGTIKVCHFMKKESLTGVNDVSIHLTY